MSAEQREMDGERVWCPACGSPGPLHHPGCGMRQAGDAVWEEHVARHMRKAYPLKWDSIPPYPGALDPKQAILDEAGRFVTGARRGAYGTPENNFKRIARFWQAYFENTGRPEAAITAKDVSPLMRLVKEARLCETPDHWDSLVDLVGYTLTGAEVNGARKP